jgi:hypothetical protein
MPVDISRFVFGQQIITIAIGRSLLAFFEFDLESTCEEEMKAS